MRAVTAALAHRGPDGQRLRRSPFAALAHLHHWTTPEEVGERQPLAGACGRLHASFDGRLDNRADLLRQLGLDAAADGPLSDARLMLRAFERWGEGCFERLEGPFAAVIFDSQLLRLVCARDPLGSRTLFYGSTGRRFVAASEERAVACHPAIDETPDECRLAWHMALRVPADGRTFFRGVTELGPGELLVVDEHRLSRRSFRVPRPVAGLDRLSDAECAERFGELLDRSVANRLRAVGPTSVLMSGGLDSTSVAALAARRLAVGGGAPPTPISWVFDELADCDERRFIEPVCRAIGARPLLLRGDDLWPLGENTAWAANPNSPEENPYRRLKTAAYAATARRGGTVLLTGGFGDQLWTGAAWWLADLLAAGRPLTAAGELARELGERRSRALGGLRRALRLPALRRAQAAGWLSADARRLVAGDRDQRLAAATRGRERLAGLLGPRNPRSATLEIFHAAAAGIELRHPYRDLRLVEFVLGLPAHQLYRRGRKKHLLRLALGGLLPPELLARRRPTGLGSLYRRGLEERETAAVDRLLAGPSPHARRMIRPEWLVEVRGRERTSPEELALWHLLSTELWHRRHSTAGRQELRRTA